MIKSVNPATGQTLAAFDPHDLARTEERVEIAAATFLEWRRTSFQERSKLLLRAGRVLRERQSTWARIMTEEMGKPIRESSAEIEKCAWVCDYYAEHAESFLADQPRESGATESFVQFTPIGPVLAIMPWNFPFWQVFRFAAPALMAGNTGLLKHASNVPRCALAIEEIFRDSGFPPGAFQTLLISGSQASRLVEDPRVAAVTLTGSEEAGAQVASTAGGKIKKSVLELGGSDPFIVLEDADVAEAARVAVKARFQNCGQSCIAAKRFIVAEPVFDCFLDRFAAGVRKLKVGDPMDPDTEMGPMARDDLRDDLDRQVGESIQLGAQLVCGGKRIEGRGYYYQPTLLSGVSESMPAAREEVFGPVAALFRVADAEAAVALANRSDFGLGSSLWTRDLDLAKRLARRIEAGQVFVNGMVASDPRLPFGGVKRSGYGRELSEIGIREFVNIQTVWIG